MLWSIQKGLPFSFEESSSSYLLNQNEARLEDVKLCSEPEGAAPAAQFCSTSLLWGFPEDLLHCSSSRERSLAFTGQDLIPAALWLLQGIWRLGHELKIMLFDSLRLYINCLEDSCCSLLQQDLGHLSAQGREFCYPWFWQWCAARPVTQTCMFRTLTAPCAWNITWDFTVSCHLYSGKREERRSLILLPSHNMGQGAGKSISRAFFLWPWKCSLSAPAVTV